MSRRISASRLSQSAGASAKRPCLAQASGQDRGSSKLPTTPALSWFSMDAANQLEQVRVLLAHDGPVPILKQVAMAPVAQI